MSLLKGLCIAFSMYSKIPVPQFEWKEKDMKYSICFFPLIGIIICAVMYLAVAFADILGIEEEIILVPALAVIPAIITGGIHLDGFMDVSDALSSYQSREKKLEILKDPHIGAFAVIKVMVLAAVYVIGLSLCLIYGSDMFNMILVLGLGMVLSRALSGISVVSFACAKKEGTLYSFAEGSDKKRCLVVLIKEAGIVMLAMVFVGKITGIVAIVTALLTFLYYHFKSKKEFGGITGDVAGWFVCLCEVTMALMVGICACISCYF